MTVTRPSWGRVDVVDDDTTTIWTAGDGDTPGAFVLHIQYDNDTFTGSMTFFAVADAPGGDGTGTVVVGEPAVITADDVGSDGRLFASVPFSVVSGGVLTYKVTAAGLGSTYTGLRWEVQNLQGVA